jgi:hypothetical protein
MTSSPNPTPLWKTISTGILGIMGIFSVVLTFVEHKSVIGFMKASVNWLEVISNGNDPGDTPKQMNLLSTLTINRVYHDFQAKNNTISSGFLLSQTAIKQLGNSSFKTIKVVISFEDGQDSVNLWIKDVHEHYKSIKLQKDNGVKISSERGTERSFSKYISEFHGIDPKSISEITIEGDRLKSKTGSFTIKNLTLE